MPSSFEEIVRRHRQWETRRDDRHSELLPSIPPLDDATTRGVASTPSSSGDRKYQNNACQCSVAPPRPNAATHALQGTLPCAATHTSLTLQHSGNSTLTCSSYTFHSSTLAGESLAHEGLGQSSHRTLQGSHQSGTVVASNEPSIFTAEVAAVSASAPSFSDASGRETKADGDPDSHLDADPPVALSASTASVLTRTRSPPLSTSPELLALPFTPYAVQYDMSRTITSVLHSASPNVVPVAVIEVPTGCGKTMALLSSVLRYQRELKRKTPQELERYLHTRRPAWRERPQTTTSSGAPPDTGISQSGTKGKPVKARKTSRTGAPSNSDPEDDEDGWAVPPSFFKSFRVDAKRKIRAELDVNGSQELRRRFLPPPCTIFYVTRTHAQLRQAVRELRRLHGASSGAVRMNILGSRERYCIHPSVVKAKTDHTLPVEGNNLGEVCDKLVSLRLCEMVDKYDALSCSAITGPIGRQSGQVWDIEDLVLEGSSRHMCPYYAARDLIFFADVNFCTYPYLLDPLIRHETKMEAALKNNTIVVFDEAHNVAPVCQDALSLECPRSVLSLILAELAPLARSQAAPHGNLTTAPPLQAGQKEFATFQYPRDLHLGAYALVDIFGFLFAVFQSISVFFDGASALSGSAAVESADVDSRRQRKRQRTPSEDAKNDTTSTFQEGSVLATYVRRDMEAYALAYQQRACSVSERSEGRRRRSTAADVSLDLFQRAYGVVMSLGVTFNPFLFSIFGMSMLKRWLLLLRFLFQKPRSFAFLSRQATASFGAESSSNTSRSLSACLSEAAGALTATGSAPSGSCTIIEMRCLDGGLAFGHLLRSVHRVVLASGTLSPFTQLARDLALESSLWRTVEGLHVVPVSQFSLTALTTLPRSASPTTPEGSQSLRCTYASLSQPHFVKAVADAVVQLTQTLRSAGGGGVLCFVPNYEVMHVLAKLIRASLLAASQAQQQDRMRRPVAVELFLEPRKAEALPEVLTQFQQQTAMPRCGTALLFAVYRGKVSEGLDFTDDMARLVLCLGVPLQPLKSWKVLAQRAYNGPEWYVTDAVRAVNQALGRCLRHKRDYGAVVLLDERYAQVDYTERLSKWCRTALQVQSSLPELCASLKASLLRWRHQLGTPLQLYGGCAASPPTEESGGSTSFPAIGQRQKISLSHLGDAQSSNMRRLLGTELLPFERVLRHPHAAPLRNCLLDGGLSRSMEKTAPFHSDSYVEPPQDGERRPASVHPNPPATSCRKGGGGVLQSPLACTAAKLLYESANSTCDVSRQALQNAMESLTQNFFEGSSSCGSEPNDEILVAEDAQV